MDRTESIILRGLLYDADYMRRVIPFIQESYFLEKTERQIFIKIKAFIEAYNTLPTKEMLIIDYTNAGVDQDEVDEFSGYLADVEKEKDDVPNVEWLTTRTEEWCQEKAIHNAMLEALLIMDGKSKGKDKGMIPKMLQDALAVSFDPHIGHDYFEDAESRYEFYHKIDARIPFHLEYFNKITKNGVPNKTLNICIAGINVGKSLFLCDLAANYVKQGKKVLYITMEMAEERIAERIDANMMNRPVDDLTFMSKDQFMKAIDRINGGTKGGKLIVKEYATAQAHVGHFRHLLNELWLKKSFKPDAIFIDYLNICASSRMKASAGMYELVKSIAEELRGLAVEFGVPIWSATQFNREGINSSDPDMTNTSESMGLPATADFMFALINSDELTAMNQFLVKILKNRYGDKFMRNKETGKIMNKFAVGVDRSKQKLFNLEESAQKGLNDEPMVVTTGHQHKAISPLEDDAVGEDNISSEATIPADDVTLKSDGIVFECDLPVSEQPFSEANEEAERRRNSAKNDVTPYKSKQVSSSPWQQSQQQKPKKKWNNI